MTLVRGAAPGVDEHQAAAGQSAGPVGGDRWPVWGAGAGVAVAALLSGAVRRTLPDDAWITLDFARNLTHGHWTLVAGRAAVNTQTSPLNAWLLAAVLAVVDRPVVAVAAVLALCLAVIGWQTTVLARACGAPRWSGVAAVAVLGTSPLLVSTVGLETYLGVAVLASVARCAVQRRPLLTGVAGGLAVLVRPDVAVPAAVLVAALVAPRSWWRVGVVAVAVATPWQLFAWWRLGGVVPDTTWFKTLSGVPANLLVAAVTVYGREYAVAAALASVPVVAGVVAAVLAVWRRAPGWRVVAGLSAAGWAHLLALVAIDAYPQAWYYAPAIGCGALAAVLGLPWPRSLLGAVVVLAVGCAAWAGPVPWSYAPMATNFASAEQYQRIGGDLAALTGGQPVAGPGEIGALAASSATPVLDHFSDRGLARPYLDLRAEQAGPVLRTFLAWNWTHRPDVPTPVLRWRLAFASLPRPAGRVVAAWPVSSPSKPHPERVLLVDTAG